jgi:hypothetical protein
VIFPHDSGSMATPADIPPTLCASTWFKITDTSAQKSSQPPMSRSAARWPHIPAVTRRDLLDAISDLLGRFCRSMGCFGCRDDPSARPRAISQPIVSLWCAGLRARLLSQR